MGAARGEEDGEGRCGERCPPSWYVSREEIESGSPSRRDGVSAAKEAELRATYCSFIRDVCIRLRLPQITMATAIMLCHRFYLRQSHAKNEWQTIATVCIFLGSKIEDTPCSLKHVVIVSYETMYHKNPDAAKRIRQEEVLAKQKALILVGETLLLSTISFDFNIHHPYEPLKLALKKLGIVETELRQSAMSLINDTLPSTLVIQLKPQYIAAASLWLAAKFHNVNLSQNGTVWWHAFDVAPDPLRAVVQQMSQLFEKRAPCSMGPVMKPVPASSATDKHQTKPAPTPTPTPMDKHQIKQVPAPAPMHRDQIKPAPTPTPMDKHQIKQIPTPTPTCRHQINPIPTPMDKPQSKLAPTPPMDKQQMQPTPAPMDKQQIKPAAAPVPTDRCQRASTPVRAPRDTQSSRRSFSNSSNTEAPRCVPAGRSSNEKPRGRSPRSEGHWYRGKDGENQHWQRHVDHDSEQRPEERSNQRSLKSGLAHLVRSGAATEVRNLTRQKRRIQEVGGLPTPVYTSGYGCLEARQVSGVVVFETKRQKVERR